MPRKYKFGIPLSTLLLISLIGLLPITGSVSTTEIKLQTWKANEPILDGDLEEKPWRESSSEKIDLFYANQSTGLALTVLSIHTPNQMLYLGFNVPMPIINNLTFTLIFRTNYSEPLWRDKSILGSGHDVKQLRLTQNISTLYDCHTIVTNNISKIVNDTTIDFSVAYRNNTDYWGIEFSLPFNSSDLLGNDPNLLLHNTLDLFIEINFDFNSPNNLTQYHFISNSYDYILLNIRQWKQYSLPTLIIGLPIAVIAIVNVSVVLYLARKSKQNS
ncbi:MAG: hypothetical protein FK734_15690 [Asgard group archaeon]|nr:hypothetical protein [Asgard group archaeon]